MTAPTPLSPAAQAVLKAADDAISEWPPVWEKALAAALRAAADQVVPIGDVTDNMSDVAYERHKMKVIINNRILAIATELNGGAQ